MVTTVIIVMVIDTQGSWHINLASLFPGISKTLIACMEGILCRVKAATSVFNFFVLTGQVYLWGQQSYYHTCSGKVDSMSYSRNQK